MSNTPLSSLSDEPSYDNDPLSLHATDDPSAQLVTPTFNGTNYVRWSRAMRLALSANNKLGFIDGTCPNSSSSTEPTYSRWLRCDRIVISWIINSMEPKLADAFLYASSAKQLWDDIECKFGVSNGPLLYQLERQVTDTVQGQSPVAVYYMTLNKVWDEFASFFPFPVCSCGGDVRFAEFEQRRKVIKFLMGLNDGFDSVRAQILMMDPLPSIDTAFSMVLQVEKQRNIMHDISESSTESGVVHVMKSSHNVNLNSDDCGCGRMEKSGQCKTNPNAAADTGPDEGLINAIVLSVVKMLKGKYGVELTNHRKPETCDQKVHAQINEPDKQQEQEREQALRENSCIDTDITINHADPSPDLHNDENRPSLADPSTAASSDHTQAATPANSLNQTTTIERNVSPAPASSNHITTTERTVSPSPASSNHTTTTEHTVSPSPASSNQTSTSEHTISHSSSISPITKTKKKKVETSEISTSETILVTKKIGSYNSSQKILLVGEGDFSFSTCLALAFGSASNMVATSLNSKGFLTQNYANFSANEKELLRRGCIVLHGIDATKMATHSQLSTMKFHRIIFNFPHSGFRSEEKSTNSETGRHQTLVSGFLRNAKKMIEKNGQIHIRHKCTDAFLKWNIPKLASDQGLSLVAEPPFRRSKYPGYHTKYGFGGDKDFDCDPSKTYMLGLAS